MAASAVWVVLDPEGHVDGIHSAELAALRQAVGTPGSTVVQWPFGTTRAEIGSRS